MNFIKKLIIRYLFLFALGLTITIISNINPYFLFTYTFTLLVLLFYVLLGVHLFFTIFYLFTRPRAKIKDYRDCFDVKGYKVIICHLCDNYPKCKEKKSNEKNI